MPGVDPWETLPAESSNTKLSDEYIKARRQVRYVRHGVSGDYTEQANGVGISPLGVIIRTGRSTRILIPWHRVLDFIYSHEDLEAKRVIGDHQ